MRAAASIALVGALALGCTGTARHPAAPAPTVAPTAASTAAVTHDRTVWLCRPGTSPDPCAGDLTATAVGADGSHRLEPAPRPRRTDLDCFYVYPTVSQERGPNADLRVQASEIQVAQAQAARFSPVCRVWAPMYRQRTTTGLADLLTDAPNSAANLLAAASLRAAWRDYVTHDNDGRRVVFIGHSQGAAMLIRLLRTDVDPDPAMRAKMALALLVGGNVTVARGATSGGSFAHLSLCARRGQSGCVIAFSTFPGEPPRGAFFGRAGFGVSFLAGEDATTAGRDVACVNPAAPGGTAPLHTYFPSDALPGTGVTTPWTSFPARYVAQCRRADGATWLQVTATGGATDVRPTAQESLGARWGFHVVDVNLTLGDLVSDVAAVAH